MNKVCIIGNLASDVNFNIYEKNNRLTMVANVFVAVNRIKSKKSSQKPPPDYLPVTAFNKIAGAMSENLRKGSKVGIYGRIQPKRWTDKNGNRRFDIGIVVKKIDFLGPKAKSDANLAKTSKRAPKK